MNSLKMSPLGSCWCRATPIDGDIINERQGTETAGGAGGSEGRQVERSWSWTHDGSVLPAGQADLAAIQGRRRLRLGASESGQARAAAQDSEIAFSGTGALSGA